ncbi:hypothetical protein NUITMVRA1_01800 [Aerococcus viridans]|nr:hypothetical protein NUITMVRA1_01800 [Aerococcus viridans]
MFIKIYHIDNINTIVWFRCTSAQFYYTIRLSDYKMFGLTLAKDARVSYTERNNILVCTRGAFAEMFKNRPS